MAIHIVTDSTADLTPELLQQYGVTEKLHIVPLTVHFGDDEYRDGVDISTSDFYELLSGSKVMPRTSQPSPAAFADLYHEISSPGDTILSFHISGKLSGTYQSALIASRQFEDRNIQVIDTRSASLGLGIVAMEAALGLSRGADAETIVERAQTMMQNNTLLFLVDTLEYLHKNGRIGKAQALVGGLLNVKPLLTLQDGVVTPLDKFRGKARARTLLLERLFAGTDADTSYTGAILHANEPEEAKTLAQRVQAHYKDCRLLIAELGPTIGTHAGPGTLGVVLFEK